MKSIAEGLIGTVGGWQFYWTNLHLPRGIFYDVLAAPVGAGISLKYTRFIVK